MTILHVECLPAELAKPANQTAAGVTALEERLDNLSADEVEYDGDTAQAVLDNAKTLQSYAALRAYAGRAGMVRLTAPGVAGPFRKVASGPADNGGTVIVGVFTWERLFEGDYLESWWQPAKNSVTDDAVVYQAIAAALPEGAVLRATGAGTRLLGLPVGFPQNALHIICDPGVKFAQKAGTPTIDTLITVTGVFAKLEGFDMDGNLLGNPTESYTGRGELLKVTGDLATVRKLVVRNTHVKDHACGLYVTSKDVTIKQVTAFGAGRVVIRDKGDRTRIDNVRSFAPQNPTRFKEPGAANYLFDVGNRVISKDGANENNTAPFEWVHYSDIHGHSTATGFLSTIVVDDSIHIGGRVIVENILCDYPNSTGPDVIKFVRVRRVDIFGLTTTHAGSSLAIPPNLTNTSLRFQENVESVHMQGLDLAGMINFDTTNYVRASISGDCHIGRTLKADACIDDFPNGVLTVSAGAVLSNFYKYPIRTNPQFFDAKILLESLIYRGSETYLAAPWATASDRCIVRHSAYMVAGVKQRIDVGQIQIASPTEILRTRTAKEGRWVTETDGLESAVRQDGGILVAAAAMTTNGPESNGWVRGMQFVRRDPIAGQAVYKYVCVTSGAAAQESWANSTDYTVGRWRGANGNVYVCVQDGTSAASGAGPSEAVEGILDGTCVWDFVDTRAVFKGVSSIAA